MGSGVSVFRDPSDKRCFKKLPALTSWASVRGSMALGHPLGCVAQLGAPVVVPVPRVRCLWFAASCLSGCPSDLNHCRTQIFPGPDRERWQQRPWEGASWIKTGEISLHMVRVILSCSAVPLFQVFLIVLLKVEGSLISVFVVVLGGTAQDSKVVWKQGQTDFSVPDFNLSLYPAYFVTLC